VVAAAERARPPLATRIASVLALAKYAALPRCLVRHISIALENGKLVMRFSHSPSLTGDLEHFQYDTFIARCGPRAWADAYVTFALKPTGLSIK